MPIDLTLPDIGGQATVLRWLRSTGEKLTVGEPLVIVLSETAEAVLPAVASGTLEAQLVAEGETASVGAALARIAAGTGAAPQPAVRATPTARRIADEVGIDLAGVRGSGPDGRITRRDVEQALAGQNRQQTVAEPAGGFCIAEQLGARLEQPVPSQNGREQRPQPAPRPEQTPAGDLRRSELVPLTAMRRAIAEHMVRSKATSPHLTTAIEVDMGAVAEARARLRERFARRGVDLTYTACIASCTIEALRSHRRLNASWHPEGIVEHGSIHLGVAVAVEAGLVVPVIKNAADLNLQGLARAINDVAARARAGALQPDELQGGTFTITNPGAGAIRFGIPVIPQPQAAILGVGTIQKRVVVVEDGGADRLAIRPLVVLTLSVDARVADLPQADALLAEIKRRLESFSC